MNKIRGMVVAVLLAVWCFPAVSSAKALPPEPAAPLAMGKMETRGATETAAASTGTESANLAQREQQAPNLQNFKGGSAVIFVSSGALLVAVIILLILLI